MPARGGELGAGLRAARVERRYRPEPVADVDAGQLHRGDQRAEHALGERLAGLRIGASVVLICSSSIVVVRVDRARGASRNRLAARLPAVRPLATLAPVLRIRVIGGVRADVDGRPVDLASGRPRARPAGVAGASIPAPTPAASWRPACGRTCATTARARACARRPGRCAPPSATPAPPWSATASAGADRRPGPRGRRPGRVPAPARRRRPGGRGRRRRGRAAGRARRGVGARPARGAPGGDGRAAGPPGRRRRRPRRHRRGRRLGASPGGGRPARRDRRPPPRRPARPRRRPGRRARRLRGAARAAAAGAGGGGVAPRRASWPRRSAAAARRGPPAPPAPRSRRCRPRWCGRGRSWVAPAPPAGSRPPGGTPPAGRGWRCSPASPASARRAWRHESPPASHAARRAGALRALRRGRAGPPPAVRGGAGAPPARRCPPRSATR